MKISDLEETPYKGNIGMMEIMQFMKIATPDEKDLFDKLVSAGALKKAWQLIQDVVGVKLQGTEFTEAELTEIIRKVKGGYRLYSKKGKNLGTYPSKTGAEKRERQVQYFKHMGEDNKLLDKPTLTVKELADKHGVDTKEIMSELVKGIKAELEHTSDPHIAKEIALDHLSEHPRYYSEIHKLMQPDEPGYKHTALSSPQNTLVVDKSDDMDFFKLGQHYPNISKLDPHEIGVGGSDIIMTFASKEEMENMMLALDKMGVAYRDIGGSHEHPEIHTKENFADGKKPGRKGLAKRMDVDCSKSETELRKIASKSSGEKQRMAHWCANMKGGKNEK